MADSTELRARRRSPLHDHGARMQAGSGSAVALRELPLGTLVGLDVAPSGPGARALEAELGIGLPRAVGQVTVGQRHHVLWLGPTEFAVISDDEWDGPALPARLQAALEPHPGQVVDLSASRTTLELSGPAAPLVLRKGCRLDLHPSHFGTGTAVVTLVESVGVILWRFDDRVWRLLPRASFAGHLLDWLLDAMREFH